MATKLFVGNLPWSTTEQELEELFAQYGQVEEVHLPTDRDTGRPRGFGFVTFVEADAAHAAVEALHDQEFNGRPLTVNEARPRRDEA